MLIIYFDTKSGIFYDFLSKNSKDLPSCLSLERKPRISFLSDIWLLAESLCRLLVTSPCTTVIRMLSAFCKTCFTSGKGIEKLARLIHEQIPNIAPAGGNSFFPRKCRTRVEISEASSMTFHLKFFFVALHTILVR